MSEIEQQAEQVQPNPNDEFLELNEKRFYASVVKALRAKGSKEGGKKEKCDQVEKAIMALFPEFTNDLIDVLVPEGDPIEAFITSPMAMPSKPYEALFHDIQSKPKASDEKKAEAEAIKTEGNALLKDSEFKKAIEKYSKAIDSDPHNPVYYCNRAAAYTKNNNLMEAVDDCQIALLLDPKYDKAHARIAYAYSCLGKYEHAKTSISKVLELDPENVQYKTNSETIDEQLKTIDPSLQQAANIPGFPQGGGSGMEHMFQFMQDPTFIQAAQEMMKSQDFQQHIAQVMSSMGGVPGQGLPPGQGLSGAVAGGGTPQLGANINPIEAMQLGQQMTANMDPEELERLRANFAHMMPPSGAGQDAPGNDPEQK